MEVKKINNKEIWENFLLGVKEKTFLQSWNWGQFNQKMGDEIFRLGVYKRQATGDKQQEPVAIALVIKVKARRGSFLFMPHGPAIRQQATGDLEEKLSVSCGASKQQVLEVLLGELKKIAADEKASFIRVAPVWERNKENNEIFRVLGFRPAPIHMHPELTWELDVSRPEEELLRQMRKTTRYLVKKGLGNREIEIEKSRDIRDVGKFNSLYQQTKRRQHFTPFSLEYLRNEFKAFYPDNQISIFLGEYLKQVVSSGIFVFWQDIGFYHHGASSLEHPKIPVSYVIMWEAIKEAKMRGCQKFNFWGIAPSAKFGIHSAAFKAHPWAGLSLFKMGFGGKPKEYIRTQDFVLSKRYWFTLVIEKLRKIKRGL